jgi:hypothetical protein
MMKLKILSFVGLLLVLGGSSAQSMNYRRHRKTRAVRGSSVHEPERQLAHNHRALGETSLWHSLNSAWLSATSSVTETTRTTQQFTNTVACKAKKKSKKSEMPGGGDPFSRSPYGDSPYGDEAQGQYYGKSGKSGKRRRRHLETSQRRRTKSKKGSKQADLLPYCEDVIAGGGGGVSVPGGTTGDVPNPDAGGAGEPAAGGVLERSCTAIAGGTGPTTDDGVRNNFVVSEPIEVTLTIAAGGDVLDPSRVSQIVAEYGTMLQTVVAPALAGCETTLSRSATEGYLQESSLNIVNVLIPPPTVVPDCKYCWFSLALFVSFTSHSCFPSDQPPARPKLVSFVSLYRSPLLKFTTMEAHLIRHPSCRGCNSC